MSQEHEPSSRDEDLGDCLRMLCEQTRRLEFLQREVGEYLAKPGCNANSRRTKFERLAWALGMSRTMQ